MAKVHVYVLRPGDSTGVCMSNPQKGPLGNQLKVGDKIIERDGPGGSISYSMLGAQGVLFLRVYEPHAPRTRTVLI